MNYDTSGGHFLEYKSAKESELEQKVIISSKILDSSVTYRNPLTG